MLALEERKQFYEDEYYSFEDGDPLEQTVEKNPLRLRHYQLDALTAIDESVAAGRKRPLVVMATGTGKTPLLVSIPFKRALFLSVGMEKAEQSATQYDDVVVASIQTLGARRKITKEGEEPDAHPEYELTRRLKKWNNKHFDWIVIDEAHHALGNSYLRILQHFGVQDKDGPCLLGVTATPFRGDGGALSNVFDENDGEPAFKYPLEQATNDGWLCDILYKRVKSAVDISAVAPRGDDLNLSELSEKVNVDQRNSLIVSSVVKHAVGRKHILVFAVDVEHAESLAGAFKDKGYKAAAIHYKIPKQEKENLLSAFRTGELQVLVNVAILTEGVDIPTVDCLVFSRPTRSMGLLSQMLGRGTRQLCPMCKSTHFDVVDRLPMRWACNFCDNKWSRETAKTCLVLDIVDLVGNLSIRGAMSLFGEREVDLLNEPIREALPVLRQANQLGVVVKDDDTIDDVKKAVERVEALVANTRHIDTQAEAIDLFRSTARPAGNDVPSVFPWQKLGDDKFVLFAMNGKRIGVWRNDLGEWCFAGAGRKIQFSSRQKCPWGNVDKLIKRVMNNRVQVSDNYSVAAWKFITASAKWRTKKAKPTQVEALKRIGVKVVPDKLSRGSAHDMLALIEYHREKNAKAVRSQA